VAILLTGCAADQPSAPSKNWLWSRTNTTPQEFEVDRGQCRQQALMLPPSPMPHPPSSSPTPRSGGFAPDASFAQGAAAADYEASLSRHQRYENERRKEFFNACMFGKGYQQVPE